MALDPSKRQTSRNQRRRWDRSDDFGFGRLAALTDGVFAVAITLVAVQLTIEKPEDNTAGALFGAIGAEYGAWIGFIVAFIILARYWTSNHSFYDRLQAIDSRVVKIQMAYLFFVVLLPFGTRLVGDYGDNPGSVVVLAILLAALSLIETLLFGYAARAGLLDYSPTDSEFKWAMVASLTPVVTFTCTLPLAWVDTSLAMLSWIPLGVLFGVVIGRLAPAGALSWSRDMT